MAKVPILLKDEQEVEFEHMKEKILKERVENQKKRMAFHSMENLDEHKNR